LTETYYFQVTLTINNAKTLEREFGDLNSIPDNYPKTVITYDTFSDNTYAGMQTLSLEGFLL
jgi:uncharacterized protein